MLFAKRLLFGGQVRKPVEAGDAYGLQKLLAFHTVVLCVKFRYQGQTDDDPFRADQTHQLFQIFQHLSVILAGVAAVNFRIGVLAVDDEFVDATGGEAKTLLVRGGERMKRSNYGNVSDDEVENYSYDYYFTNDKPLEQTELLFKEFLASILEG